MLKNYVIKPYEFSRSMALTEYDVVILIESWLTNDVADQELQLGSFDVFRCDRNVITSGGVLIAVKKHTQTREELFMCRN